MMPFNWKGPVMSSLLADIAERLLQKVVQLSLLGKGKVPAMQIDMLIDMQIYRQTC